MKLLTSIATALLIATVAQAQTKPNVPLHFSRSQIASNEAWLTLTSFKPQATNTTAKVSAVLVTNLISSAVRDSEDRPLPLDPETQTAQLQIVTNVVKVTTFTVRHEGRDQSFDKVESLWMSAPIKLREKRPKKTEWEVVRP